MKKEAEDILEIFRVRGVRAPGWIHYTEFGDAIIWEDGFIRDEAVRDALRFLYDEGYLIELNAGPELTIRGELHAYRSASAPSHGARIYRVGGKLLVKQTVLRGVPEEYAIDDQHERQVDERDDPAIAAAVRDAINGCL